MTSNHKEGPLVSSFMTWRKYISYMFTSIL